MSNHAFFTCPVSWCDHTDSADRDTDPFFDARVGAHQDAHERALRMARLLNAGRQNGYLLAEEHVFYALVETER